MTTPTRNLAAVEDNLALLDLALRWLPFGGPPPEDVFLQLGISYAQFWHRLELSVQRRSSVLSDRQRAALRNFIYETGKRPRPAFAPLVERRNR